VVNKCIFQALVVSFAIGSLVRPGVKPEIVGDELLDGGEATGLLAGRG
jgi:hypothetical protein